MCKKNIILNVLLAFTLVLDIANVILSSSFAAKFMYGIAAIALAAYFSFVIVEVVRNGRK